MGDAQARTRSTATETTPAAPSSNAATQVQTVADLKVGIAAEEHRTRMTDPSDPHYSTLAHSMRARAENINKTIARLQPQDPAAQGRSVQLAHRDDALRGVRRRLDRGGALPPGGAGEGQRQASGPEPS